MTTAGIRVVFWICTGACAVLASAAASGRVTSPFVSTCYVLSAAGFLGAFVWRRWAQLRAELQQSERDALRYIELRRQLEIDGATLDVLGSSGSGLAVLLMLATLAGGYFAWREPGIANLALTVFLAACAFVLLLDALPVIRKPVLTLRPGGIETPAYGFLHWSEIESVSLREVTSKGATLNHVLDVRVTRLDARTGRMHWAAQLLYRLLPFGYRREGVRIRLMETSESPRLVYRLCAELWLARTRSGAASAPVSGREDERPHGDRSLELELERSAHSRE